MIFTKRIMIFSCQVRLEIVLFNKEEIGGETFG